MRRPARRNGRRTYRVLLQLVIISPRNIFPQITAPVLQSTASKSRSSLVLPRFRCKSFPSILAASDGVPRQAGRLAGPCHSQSRIQLQGARCSYPRLIEYVHGTRFFVYVHMCLSVCVYVRVCTRVCVLHRFSVIHLNVPTLHCDVSDDATVCCRPSRL